MNEAAKLSEQFKHYSREDRDKKLRGCVEILKEYPQKAIQVSVNIGDFQRHIAHEMPRSVRDPYFLAFFGILSAVCYEVNDTGAPEEVEVIFDEHSIFRPRIDVWYPWVRDNIGILHDPALSRVLPLNPLFRSDKVFVPLQPADMLAWLFRNAYSGNRNEFEWIAVELMKAEIPMSIYATMYDAERMRHVSELTTSMLAKITPQMVKTFEQRVGLKMVRETVKPKHVQTEQSSAAADCHIKSGCWVKNKSSQPRRKSRDREPKTES